MKNFDKDKIIDAEFFDIDEEMENKSSKTKIIRGKPLFYTTSQVAQMIDVPKSTITYWSKVFNGDLLKIKNKRYKESDIKILKLIKKLAKEDGLTLKQVSEYCSSEGFNIDKIEKNVIDSSNPLAIQTIMSALTIEIDKKLNSFSENLLNQIGEKQKNGFLIQQQMNDKLHESIASTIDEVVSEKLDNHLQEFKSYIDERERKATSRDIEMIDMLKHNMEERQKQQEKLELEKKKSFWGRLFKR